VVVAVAVAVNDHDHDPVNAHDYVRGPSEARLVVW